MAWSRPVVVPTRAGAYQLNIKAISRAVPLRARAPSSPSRKQYPTGAILHEADLRAVNTLCATRGISHIHDEVSQYFACGQARHLHQGERPAPVRTRSALLHCRRRPGSRAGAIGGVVDLPRALSLAVDKIRAPLLICAPHVSQAATVGALTRAGAECATRIAPLAEVRQQS